MVRSAVVSLVTTPLLEQQFYISLYAQKLTVKSRTIEAIEQETQHRASGCPGGNSSGHFACAKNLFVHVPAKSIIFGRLKLAVWPCRKQLFLAGGGLLQQVARRTKRKGAERQCVRHEIELVLLQQSMSSSSGFINALYSALGGLPTRSQSHSLAEIKVADYLQKLLLKALSRVAFDLNRDIQLEYAIVAGFQLGDERPTKTIPDFCRNLTATRDCPFGCWRYGYILVSNASIRGAPEMLAISALFASDF